MKNQELQKLGLPRLFPYKISILPIHHRVNKLWALILQNHLF